MTHSALELGLHYVVVGQVTDADIPGQERNGGVTQAEVTAGGKLVADRANQLLRACVQHPAFQADDLTCRCRHALEGAIITNREGLSSQARERFLDIVGLPEIPPEWFAHP